MNEKQEKELHFMKTLGALSHSPQSQNQNGKCKAKTEGEIKKNKFTNFIFTFKLTISLNV